MRLFLILLAVPIVEIYLFLEIGGWIGTWPTIATVVATAALGSVLLRGQGLAVMRDARSRLRAGEAPGRLLADGAMILIAGALLLTPGFFTDAVGFALLVPPVRAVVWAWISARIEVVGAQASGAAEWPLDSAAGSTVDGEFTEVRQPSNSDRAPSGPPLDRPDDAG